MKIVANFDGWVKVTKGVYQPGDIILFPDGRTQAAWGWIGHEIRDPVLRPPYALTQHQADRVCAVSGGVPTIV